MGERGADHAEVPNEREIEEMARLTEEALRAGALGFTTSRTTKHKAKDGRFTPSLSAREAELLGIAAGMKRAGTRRAAGQFRLRPGRVRGARRGGGAGRPAAVRACWCRSTPSPSCGARRSTRSTACARRPRRQRAGRLAADRRASWGCETTAHPFAAHPAWLEMRKLSPAERYARLAGDAELRRRLVETPRRRRLARLHGRVVPQDVPDRRPAGLRARCRQLGRRHRPAQRPHAAGRGARRA